MTDNINGLTQNLSNLKLNPAPTTSQPEPTPPLPEDVTFCDDVETLRIAIADLGASRTLILDCEGRDLGTQGGALSLVSVRVTEPIPKTYVFDILRLHGYLEPLWALLSSMYKRKVVFDGRQDFCAMWYDYGVPLPNTIDLQLADIRSRERRGEGEVKQMQRLMRCFAPGSINNPRQRHRYIEIHLLQGLGGALIEHKVTAPAKGNVDHDSWMIRPLSEKHLFYAANDVYLIGLLLAHFEGAGYIDDELSVQSARYITIWGDFQPQRDNDFRSNPFLPLEILTYEVNAPRRPCSGCGRYLSPNAYPKDTWYGSDDSPRFCHVCTAVPIWLRRRKFFEDMKQKRKQEKEKSQNGGTVAQQDGTVGPMLSPGPPPTQNRSEDYTRTKFQKKRFQEAKARTPNENTIERPALINPAPISSPILTPRDERPIVTGSRGRGGRYYNSQSQPRGGRGFYSAQSVTPQGRGSQRSDFPPVPRGQSRDTPSGPGFGRGRGGPQNAQSNHGGMYSNTGTRDAHSANRGWKGRGSSVQS